MALRLSLGYRMYSTVAMNGPAFAASLHGALREDDLYKPLTVSWDPRRYLGRQNNASKTDFDELRDRHADPQKWQSYTLESALPSDFEFGCMVPVARADLWTIPEISTLLRQEPLYRLLEWVIFNLPRIYRGWLPTVTPRSWTARRRFHMPVIYG